MIEGRQGALVFMASTNSWDAEAELAAHNASKAGIFLLAKTLARELGQYGIRSNDAAYVNGVLLFVDGGQLA